MSKASKKKMPVLLAALASLAAGAGPALAANPCSGYGACTTSPPVRVGSDAAITFTARSALAPMRVTVHNRTTGLRQVYLGGSSLNATVGGLNQAHMYACTVNAPGRARVTCGVR